MKLKHQIEVNSQGDNSDFNWSEFLTLTGYRESSGQTELENGVYQTLKPYREEFERVTKYPITQEELRDPEIATAVVKYMTTRNRKYFKDRVGRLPSMEETYYMHHFGPQGGKSFVEASDNTLIGDLFSNWVFNANPYMKKHMTKADLMNALDERAYNATEGRKLLEEQAVLKELGYYQGKVDGHDGKGTKLARKNFRQLNGIEDLEGFVRGYHDLPPEQRARYSMTGLAPTKLYPNNRGMLRQAVDYVLEEESQYENDILGHIQGIKDRQAQGVNPRVNVEPQEEIYTTYTPTQQEVWDGLEEEGINPFNLTPHEMRSIRMQYDPTGRYQGQERLQELGGNMSENRDGGKIKPSPENLMPEEYVDRIQTGYADYHVSRINKKIEEVGQEVLDKEEYDRQLPEFIRKANNMLE